jgi:hypothetical protein
VLVVNDGSKDGTADLVQSAYVAKLGADRFRLLRLARNNGKGGAVRKGMVRARGRYLLMADADGATQASDLSRLLAEVKDVEGPGGLGIAIGSRAHMENEAGAKASRSPLRKVLMWGFHTFINIMLGGASCRDGGGGGRRRSCGDCVRARKTTPRAAGRSLPAPVVPRRCPPPSPLAPALAAQAARSRTRSAASSSLRAARRRRSSRCRTSTAGRLTWSWCTWPRTTTSPWWCVPLP